MPAAWTRCASATRSSRCMRASSFTTRAISRENTKTRNEMGSEPELVGDRVDDGFRRARRVDRQGVGGLLEVGELAGEERGPGKMAAAFCEAPCKGGLVRLQVDEPDVAQSPAQDVAIALLERRAGDDQVIAAAGGRGRDSMERGQPGGALGVGQRAPGAHFLDRRRRVM